MLQEDGLDSEMPETWESALNLGQLPRPLFPHPENGDMGACLPDPWEGLRVWCMRRWSALRGGRLGLAVSSGRWHQARGCRSAQKGRKGSPCGDGHRAGSEDRAELAPGVCSAPGAPSVLRTAPALQRSGAGCRERGAPTGQAPRPAGRGQDLCWGQESGWE